VSKHVHDIDDETGTPSHCPVPNCLWNDDSWWVETEE
jgi:hypothetical protein